MKHTCYSMCRALNIDDEVIMWAWAWNPSRWDVHLLAEDAINDYIIQIAPDTDSEDVFVSRRVVL